LLFFVTVPALLPGWLAGAQHTVGNECLKRIGAAKIVGKLAHVMVSPPLWQLL
jgi:hypothetical protein